MLISCGNEETGFVEKRVIEHEGLERSFLIYVPTNIKENAPLVVAIPGYTSSAKVNAVNNILAQTIRYINTELKRCELGEKKVMEGYLSCNNINSVNGVINTIDALTNIPEFRDNNNNYNQGVLRNFRNPYDNKKPAVWNATAYKLGQINISLAGKKIQLETCFKGKCGPLDRTENLIDFDEIF